MPTSAVGPPTLPTSPAPSPRKSRSPDIAHVPFVVPPHIAGYRIVRLLGAGGMGLVYEAVQEALGRVVALKLMQPGGVSSEALARFESEAKALGKLSHSGIARVFDAGVFRPTGDHASIVPYLSMELVEGAVTLHEHCERADVSLDEKLRLVAQVCDALEHAHAAGIIHRDLKPSNILVAPPSARAEDGSTDPEIKLIDFGIAKVLGDGSRTITSRGQLIGTPSYMAPEQFLGSIVDDRTDVYSLGVILYQICTGRLPHDVSPALDRRAMERAVCETPPTPPRMFDRALGGDLETIILKCLQKLPSERYTNVQELREDLLAFLAGESIRAKRDSTVRMARRAIGRAAARRPAIAFTACAAAGIAFAMLLVTPALLRWPVLEMRYWDALSYFVPFSDNLPDVRVIAIDNQTDLAAVAKSQGLTGVTNDNIRSARILHAAVLRKLAKAEPRAVGVDVTFRRPTEFDAPLTEALTELKTQGVGVVLVNPNWQFGEDGLPEIVPDFARQAWTGPPTGGYFSAEIWAMEIALQRTATEVIPSFSLLTYAACREPGAEIGVAFVDGAAEIRYFKPGTNRRVTLRPPDRVIFSGIETLSAPDEVRAQLSGDAFGVFLVPISMGGLARCTIPLQKFFTMSEQDVRREFAGRVVLIGNASETGNDIQVSSNGNRVPGVWTNAATVQQMLRERTMEVASVPSQWIVAGALAFAGVVVAFWFRSIRAVTAVALALTLGGICVSVLLLRTGGTIWNPIPAIAAGLLGCGLALMATHDARRVRAGRLGSV